MRKIPKDIPETITAFMPHRHFIGVVQYNFTYKTTISDDGVDCHVYKSASPYEDEPSVTASLTTILDTRHGYTVSLSDAKATCIKRKKDSVDLLARQLANTTKELEDLVLNCNVIAG